MLKRLLRRLVEKRDSGARPDEIRRRQFLAMRDSAALLQHAFYLRDHGDPAEAEAACRQVLNIDPSEPDALHLLGVIAYQRRDYSSAVDFIAEAAKLRPDNEEFQINLGSAFVNSGDAAAAVDAFRRALELQPDSAAARVNLLFALNLDPRADPGTILTEHVEWGRRHAARFCESIAPHPNVRDPSRRLRLGYVSPDFRNHTIANFIESVLASHDHRVFDVFCYDNINRPDEMTECFRRHADGWRDISELDDDAAALLVRKDKIDILVDLSGHTRHNRLLLFARKPAPVQVTYLGYPATTGLSSMDYRITDGYADPPGSSEQYYCERLTRLPDSLWCYSALQHMPQVGPLPMSTAGHVTLGSLNNFAKVNERVISLWARIMRAVPDARLVILAAAEGRSQERAKLSFTRMGIDTIRLELHDRLPQSLFFEQHAKIDVALDTFPCNGGATTCETLWMGIPVVTMAGSGFVSRAGLSLLSNVGLPELVARNEEEYLKIAVGLARDEPRLRALRADLRGMMLNSPVGQPGRYTRHLEGLYRAMWSDWCAGAARQPLSE